MANNPMLGVVNQNRAAGMMATIKNMLNTVRSAGDPQAMMTRLLGNNPQYAQVMRLVQENGGDAKKAFYALAAQSGVDGDQIINALK